MPPSSTGTQKWTLELWEHEPGKSRAQKEFSRLERENPRMFVNVSEKIGHFQTQEISILEKTQYIKKVKNGNGLYEIRLMFTSGNVRFVGPIEKELFLRPKFSALLFFHKKSDELPSLILQTALSRLKEFNAYQTQ